VFFLGARLLRGYLLRVDLLVSFFGGVSVVSGALFSRPVFVLLSLSSDVLVDAATTGLRAFSGALAEVFSVGATCAVWSVFNDFFTGVVAAAVSGVFLATVAVSFGGVGVTADAVLTAVLAWSAGPCFVVFSAAVFVALSVADGVLLVGALGIIAAVSVATGLTSGVTAVDWFPVAVVELVVADVFFAPERLRDDPC
jgi:hypothetical protein